MSAPKSGAAELRLPGAHPVHVAAQGVDLAVVGAQPEGLGQVPAGQDVGGEAGVDHGQRETDALVGEVAGRRRAAGSAVSIPL